MYEDYAHAMAQDPGTEKPMPKVAASLIGSLVKGADNNNIMICGIDISGNAASKPAASAYPFYTYWSVDTDPHGDAIEKSNGTTWTVI